MRHLRPVLLTLACLAALPAAARTPLTPRVAPVTAVHAGPGAATGVPSMP